MSSLLSKKTRRYQTLSFHDFSFCAHWNSTHLSRFPIFSRSNAIPLLPIFNGANAIQFNSVSSSVLALDTLNRCTLRTVYILRRTVWDPVCGGVGLSVDACGFDQQRCTDCVVCEPGVEDSASTGIKVVGSCMT